MARRTRPLSQGSALDLARSLFPSFLAQRDQADRLDEWSRTGAPEEDMPYMPRAHTDEYSSLNEMSKSPWAALIITALVQTIFLEGVRAPGTQGNLQCYDDWQRNGWDSKQTSLYRSAMAHGAAFGVGWPGTDALTGEFMPVMRPLSARRMAAFYADEDLDAADWPYAALEAVEVYDANTGHQTGWLVTLYDEVARYRFDVTGIASSDAKDWSYVDHETHPAGVTPVVRYENSIDLDGRITSSTEPLIPLLRRIDQDSFDRLIVQRFGAWKVRWIAGMAKPDADQQLATAMQLKIEDLLISESADTKFGTLDETQVAGFIAARDADLRDLSALSQTPPHHLLGLSSNLQAEALAAAEAGLQRKSVEHKTLWGERHEQFFRLTSKIRGNEADARRFDMQVRWRDMESRSLTQAADALQKLAVGLDVPVEMLWERIPNWTDSDTARAKKLIEDGSVNKLLEALVGGNGADQQQQAGAAPATPRDGQTVGNVIGG